MTCAAHLEYGVPDIYNALGYANIRRNPDVTGDDYGDAYCAVPYGIGYVNEIVLVATEEAPANWVRATLLACSLTNEYCYDRGSVTSTYDAEGRALYRADLNGNYYIELSPTAPDYYYVIAIRIYDYDTDNGYNPRAYWVGLDYDTDHGVMGSETAPAAVFEEDPFPECAEGCSGDCSFLSYDDDEFWLSDDWRAYCRR